MKHILDCMFTKQDQAASLTQDDIKINIHRAVVELGVFQLWFGGDRDVVNALQVAAEAVKGTCLLKDRGR